ncbi:unnamed protein product [marine sediment metagenome]|uniref:Uncharacterized protein n=1 Tax=marine sediment metagenome TaxID=412755 RepID=X1EPJ5_9ZZZZ
MKAKEMDKDCTTCIYFKSFRDDCFGDLFEPDDQGYCMCEESIYWGNEGAGYGLICDNYQNQ